MRGRLGRAGTPASLGTSVVWFVASYAVTIVAYLGLNSHWLVEMYFTPSLIGAISGGHIGHATLDVTFPEPLPEDHPLWQVPEVHLTPHVSFLGGDHLARFLEKTLANLTAYSQGAPLQDLFDRERGY